MTGTPKNSDTGTAAEGSEDHSLTLQELTLGIVHDLNNALCATIGHLESLIRLSGDDKKLERRAKAALNGCEQATALARTLLERSRELKPELVDLPLNNAVQRACEFLSSLIPSNVQLRLVHSEELTVRADRSQVQQVVTNLILNAIRAMPDGGNLTVSVKSNRGADTPFAELSVADTGCGMTPDELEKATQAFQTSWQNDTGYGLGLPMVKRIMSQHGGELKIASELGLGTTVTLSFPLTVGEDYHESNSPPSGGISL